MEKPDTAYLDAGEGAGSLTRQVREAELCKPPFLLSQLLQCCNGSAAVALQIEEFSN